MTLGNKLFLILFNIKENDKWENWKNFAAKNDFFYSTLSDPYDRPVLRGKLNNKSISIEADYNAKPDQSMHLKIKTQIHNPKDFYFLIQDKKAYRAKKGIFDRSIDGICTNKQIEDKFNIKSNSESLAIQIINSQESNGSISEELMSLSNFSIEVISYELILTSYSSIEINFEFIAVLKLFSNILNTFEQISLDSIINRK